MKCGRKFMDKNKINYYNRKKTVIPYKHNARKVGDFF